MSGPNFSALKTNFDRRHLKPMYAKITTVWSQILPSMADLMITERDFHPLIYAASRLSSHTVMASENLIVPRRLEQWH